MNGMIVAGVASIAGIAGVVGLTRATVDSGQANPVPAVVSTDAPSTLSERLTRLREAERAAGVALRRADSRAASATSGPVVAPVPGIAEDRPQGERYGDDDAYDDERRGDHDDQYERHGEDD